ncbi:MAG: hypothetical protein V1866_06830 [archaeon]
MATDAEFSLGKRSIDGRVYIWTVNYTGPWSQGDRSLTLSLLKPGSLERYLSMKKVAQYRVDIANRGLKHINPSVYQTIDSFFEDAFCKGLEDINREARTHPDKAAVLTIALGCRPRLAYGQLRA